MEGPKLFPSAFPETSFDKWKGNDKGRRSLDRAPLDLYCQLIFKKVDKFRLVEMWKKKAKINWALSFELLLRFSCGLLLLCRDSIVMQSIVP
ncbi:hypothetical protein D5R40_32415 [Okeania hirsuta]|uniref:Uncharacterized protein n=1 Tax=Okeania hirsuta TaxID=1458930 RepID=A0A3N6NTF9_9CYAN|nr:hypothetical protein D5R40_32415 [Okeania hirsuta]